ncbi:S-layer homology domain-containing protein [uncultured Dialister sp.]|uniref:S-layer homology domain-containing protein n=1 Tax=uncultured Dialister sp. TaxID=278064 RepID=UPI00266EE750|nr:S-layer homology domain-containing protein [uncultured Dialister sp.]
MKKILALAAVAALTAGVSAYAANPFSDVTPSDWAYQAVVDLSEQGVVEGYPDGTFKGERNITRYEMAQIIARMLAKEDQLNAEQRATLDKLAGEYADELANLGVRVSNLEKKVGNIYWSGDARMRYQDKAVDAADGWNGRMRINVKGQVNDSTYVQGRLTSNMDFKKSGDEDTDVVFDQLFVNHDFGKAATVRLGRIPVAFGDQGGWLYGDSYGVDGAEATIHAGDKVNLTAGYGRFNTSDYGTAITDADAFYARGAFDLNVANVGVDYIKAVGEKNTTDFAGNELIGANLVVPVSDFRVFGEYWKNTTTDSKYDTAWNAGIGYGKLNLKKPGSFAIDVAYNDVDKGIYFGGTGLQTNVLSYLTKDTATNVTFWNAIAEVALQKNVYLHGEYAFDVSTEGNTKSEEDAWTVSLNYKF